MQNFLRSLMHRLSLRSAGGRAPEAGGRRHPDGQTEDRPLRFQEVFAREAAEIRASRALRGQDAPPTGGGTRPAAPVQAGLVGLALSGGSARSATFNLGILQGLAELDLLKAFDYLSGVSGGGYIAAWLAAWVKREGSLAKVVRKLRPRSPGIGDEAEQGEIRFLRSYTSNIAPRLGLFSFDTWAFVTTYARNLFPVAHHDRGADGAVGVHVRSAGRDLAWHRLGHVQPAHAMAGSRRQAGSRNGTAARRNAGRRVDAQRLPEAPAQSAHRARPGRRREGWRISALIPSPGRSPSAVRSCCSMRRLAWWRGRTWHGRTR
jgi:hypothetical protein